MSLDKYSIAELYAEIAFRKGELISFRKSLLKIDSSQGGGVYQTDSCWMDFHDSIYVDIKKILNPSLIIDVGANIGFSSVCFAENFPEAEIIAIEPNPNLINIFHENMKINSIKNYKLITKAAGNSKKELRFVCPLGFSVDAKISNEDDVSFVSQQITLDEILEKTSDMQSVYIKIDAQGYDYEVIKGGAGFFSKSKNFIVRTEFAPAWLEKQGVNMRDFLFYLIDNFDVAELTGAAFKNNSLIDLFSRKIESSDVLDFIDYVKNRSNNQNGYTDIMFKPKTLNID